MKFIQGMHVHKEKNGELKVKQKKYTWIIPEELNQKDISKGDIVLACCKNTGAPVIVLNVFESDEEKIKHKKVLKILDKVNKIKNKNHKSHQNQKTKNNFKNNKKNLKK